MARNNSTDKVHRKRRKTISIGTLARLSFCNSRKMPQVVNDGGRRKEWVGIGWIDVGPATGREVLVIRP